MISASPSGLNRDFLFNRGTSAHVDVMRGSGSRDPSSTMRPVQRGFSDPQRAVVDDDTVSIDSSGIAQFERVMNRAATTAYGPLGSVRGPTVSTAATSVTGMRGVSPERVSNIRGLGSDRNATVQQSKASQQIRRQQSATSSNFVEDFQDENEWLRRKIRTLSEKYEQQLDEKELKIQQQQQEIRRLQKRIQKECPTVCGIGLADLHHSNERLSAQLSRLEVTSDAQENATKVKECEEALESLMGELATVENKLQSQAGQLEGEAQQLRHQLVSQQAEFNVERLECDRVVHAMSAKLEELGRENSTLRVQLQQQVVVGGGGGPISAAASNSSKTQNKKRFHRNVSSSSSNSST